jgi:hypothetical protein
MREERRLFSVLVFPILILLVLSFTLSGYEQQSALAQSEDNNLLTYTNANLGFSFKYSSDWKRFVDEGKSGGVITLQSPNNISSILVSVENIKPNETGLSLEQYAKNYVWSWGSVASNIKPLEVNTDTYYLSGHPAARIIESMNFGTPDTKMNDTKMMAFVLPLGSKVYSVQYDASPPDKFPNYLQQAQNIIDSFQIISKH